jgi:putative DNA primase/helicase
MCQDLEAVKDAQAVGMSADETVCRDPKTGAKCPLFDVCGYQRQRKQEADLWIGAHELLFSTKPKLFGELAVVIVDESVWQKGLEGVDGAPMDLTLDALAADVTVPGDTTGNDTSRLRNAHAVLTDTVKRLPLGPLPRAALAGRLYASTAKECATLSWRRRVEVDIKPGMSPAQRREAMAAAPNNRVVMRTARMFEALGTLLGEDGPEASGWLHLAQAETPDGPVRVLRMRRRKAVAKGWLVPTLLLDATLNPDLVRPYWSQLEVTADIEVATPHMRVRQQVGRDWPKSALVPDDFNPKDRDRRLKNSERLRAAVWRESRIFGGRSLVVAQKAVEDYWRTCGVMQAGLELAHHNAVAGRDEWGPGPGREGVRLLAVVGRTLPKAADVERAAEALTGAAMATRVIRYDRVDAAITLADGNTITTEVDRHPDAIAEAIRWQACEGELVQIIGRGRGVNRTSANPLDVLILTDKLLPLPVDEAVSWESLAPSAADLMLAQGGVFLESPTDASRCFENLWTSPEAAKKAAQRGQWGTIPYRELPNGECPSLVRAIYQRAGERQRPVSLVFDPSAMSTEDLRGWLEDRVGELVRLDVQAADLPPPQPTRPSHEEPASRLARLLVGLPEPPASPGALLGLPVGFLVGFGAPRERPARSLADYLAERIRNAPPGLFGMSPDWSPPPTIGTA